jgi:hypothetical protein
MSDVSFTNPTSMVGLQLLLKVMLRWVNDGDGVTTIKPGYQTTGKVCMMWSDGSSFMLFPMPGRVYVRRTSKDAYILECLVRFQQWNTGKFMMVFTAISWYSIPLLSFMAELLQGSTWTGWIIRCIPWSRRYSRMTQSYHNIQSL